MKDKLLTTYLCFADPEVRHERLNGVLEACDIVYEYYEEHHPEQLETLKEIVVPLRKRAWELGEYNPDGSFKIK